MILDTDKLGCSKFKIAEALSAEGLELATAYQNIHLIPMYQKKIGYGKKGFPWTADFARKISLMKKESVQLQKKLNEETYLGFGMCVYDLNDDDIDLIIKAFKKVWENINLLK